MLLSDTFKELHFYDYMIDRSDKNELSKYMYLKNTLKNTYVSFDSIEYVEKYFEECNHVICVTVQTNANIMNLFFYINDKYCFLSTHDNNTIVNILRKYEKKLTKLCKLKRINHDTMGRITCSYRN